MLYEVITLSRVFNKSINYFVEEVKNTHEIVYSSSGRRDVTVYA